MLKVLTGEASKFYKKKKQETELSKNMHKCVELERFHHEHWLQLYMYDFMYVDTQTMPVEDSFSATNIFCELQ